MSNFTLKRGSFFRFPDGADTGAGVVIAENLAVLITGDAITGHIVELGSIPTKAMTTNKGYFDFCIRLALETALTATA